MYSNTVFSINVKNGSLPPHKANSSILREVYKLYFFLVFDFDVGINLYKSNQRKRVMDKEPPKLSNEYKELLNNTKYMGGICPLHFTLIKDQNVCRVDFIAPALDPLNNAYVVAGVNGYAVLGKKQLGEIAEAAKRAYEGLK